MEYQEDKGGRFSSDAHRRVLAHLSIPTDNYGWTSEALLERMRTDEYTDFTTKEELEVILEELYEEGLAFQPKNEVWQMAEKGFEVLTGSIKDEPSPISEGAGRTQPAQIGSATMLDTEDN